MTAPIVHEAKGPDRAGEPELGTGEAMRQLLADPRTRNYFFAALGALVMIFLSLLNVGGDAEVGSDLGGFILVVIGISGLVLRWTPAPLLVLIVLTYFLWTPDGIPGDHKLPLPGLVESQRFNLADVILVLAVLVYLISQYRIFGFVAQAISPDTLALRKDEAPVRRQASLVTPNEFAAMLAVAVALVFAGQLVWLSVTSVDVVTDESFPFRLRTGRPSRESETGTLLPGASRFYVLVGAVFLATAIARVVFAYWRLRLLNPEEGRMILLDEGWRETHRERVRVEKWRIWGRRQAKESQESGKQRGKNT